MNHKNCYTDSMWYENRQVGESQSAVVHVYEGLSSTVSVQCMHTDIKHYKIYTLDLHCSSIYCTIYNKAFLWQIGTSKQA